MRCAMTTVNVGEGPRQPSTDEVEGVTAAGTTKGARKGRGGRVVNAWRLGDVGAWYRRLASEAASESAWGTPLGTLARAPGENGSPRRLLCGHTPTACENTWRASCGRIGPVHRGTARAWPDDPFSVRRAHPRRRFAILPTLRDSRRTAAVTARPQRTARKRATDRQGSRLASGRVELKASPSWRGTRQPSGSTVTVRWRQRSKGTSKALGGARLRASPWALPCQ